MGEAGIVPIWIVIMIAGATASGWVFLKARKMEAPAVMKKVERGQESVIKKARAVAKRPSGIPVAVADTSTEPIDMSIDMPGNVAKEIEEIVKRKSKENN